MRPPKNSSGLAPPLASFMLRQPDAECRASGQAATQIPQVVLQRKACPKIRHEKKSAHGCHAIFIAQDHQVNIESVTSLPLNDLYCTALSWNDSQPQQLPRRRTR